VFGSTARETETRTVIRDTVNDLVEAIVRGPSRMPFGPAPRRGTWIDDGDLKAVATRLIDRLESRAF